MQRPIEPSDAERAAWPETTRAYVEYLEAVEKAALEVQTLLTGDWERDTVSGINTVMGSVGMGDLS